MDEKHYAQMYAMLKRISQYQSPERLHKHSWRDWGVEKGSEAIEMAYENVLQDARRGLKGVRKPRPSTVPSQHQNSAAPPQDRKATP